MSYALDVNVLLFASDSSSPQHARATEFLGKCAASPETLCLAWPTVMGHLRMATHPAIFAAPLSPAEAMRNVDAPLGLPHVRVLGELDGFWDLYRDVTKGLAPRGNLVPDAHLAALLRQHGVVRLYTSDRDFRKFGFLDVRDPF